MNILAIDRDGRCVDDVFFYSTVIYLLAPRTPRLNHYHQSLVRPSTGKLIAPREISLILLLVYTDSETQSTTDRNSFSYRLVQYTSSSIYTSAHPFVQSPQTTLLTSPPLPHIKSIPTQIQESQQLGTGLSRLAFPTSRHSQPRKHSASQNVELEGQASIIL